MALHRQAQGNAVFTISQVADPVRNFARDPQTLTEKARHWGKLGFLVVAERQGRGAGNHLLYGEGACYDCAVLLALTEAGLHPGEQRWFADAVSVARHALANWKQARRLKEPPPPLIMDVLFIPPGGTIIDTRGEAAAKLADLKQKGRGGYTKDSFAALTISIDLGRMFEVVWTALAEKADAPQ
jgi:hypothetical protein